MLSEKEFIDIIRENEHIIHKVCNLYMHSRDDKQDLFQEIVYNAWKGVRHFRQESKFSTWLYRVALNTAITMFKKEKKQMQLKASTPEVGTTTFPDEEDPHYVALFKAIEQLSAIEKALVMLYFDDYSYDEMASITGITANNVAVKMNRIKTKLRESSKQFLD